MADDSALRIERTDDDQWAVLRDGEELSVHPNHAGAEAARNRISQAEQGDDQDGPDDYAPEEGPNPDNVGS